MYENGGIKILVLSKDCNYEGEEEMIKESLKMIYLETDYLLDSYNHNLNYGCQHENENILKDLEQLRQERINIIFEINELTKPSFESIKRTIKKNYKFLSDSEIEIRAKKSHVRWCEAIISNLMGEY